MSIAMVGTRGVPARYGGFETAVEEIGQRLVTAGHSVTVYCRPSEEDDDSADRYLGMERVELPALKRKSLETLSHTTLSSIDAIRHRQFDVVFVFNAANAPLIPLLRRHGAPIAVHVDGLEWRRGKWGKLGRRYYRVAESLAVRWADALIADAEAIGNYYRHQFDATTEMIAYGAPRLNELDKHGLDDFEVASGRYHLVVARMEPENNVRTIVEGYRRSAANWPLLIVGGAPYADDYVASIRELAGGDDRIQLVGPVWDQALLDRLYAHAGSYLHGHSVGGTNPSLLRAMGAAAPVVALDGPFSREVLGSTGSYFDGAASLAAVLADVEREPARWRALGAAAADRAQEYYTWEGVAAKYEDLARRLVAGDTRRGECSGRRTTTAEWCGSRQPNLGEAEEKKISDNTL